LNGPAGGAANLEDLRLDVKLVARPDRARPLQLLGARADDAAGGAEAAFDQKPHGERGGVPSARRQAGEEGFAGGGFIEMERLRIELRGERLDRRRVETKLVREVFLSRGQVVEPDHDSSFP